MVTKQKNVLLRNIGCRKSSLEGASVQCLLDGDHCPMSVYKNFNLVAKIYYTIALIFYNLSLERKVGKDLHKGGTDGR